MKKFIAIVLYLFLIIAFLKFNIFILFDIKQILLVFIGAFIMYMPVLINNKKFVFDSFLFGQNALWASIIQTFVQVFEVMSENTVDNGVSYSMALACRPLLYGFCIWVIFHTDEADSVQKDNISEKVVNDIKLKKDNTLEEITDNIELQKNNTSKEVTDDIKLERDSVQNNDEFKNILHDANKCRICLVNMGLTKRETEIAMLVMQKMSNAQIASELYISETTVKKHISNIFSKLEINKREQIIEKLKM